MRWVLRIAGRWPTQLPKGSADFESFARDIFWAYELPNLPSYRHAIATMIMHLDPTRDAMPKLFFAKSIRKAMANQIAYDQIQKIKEEEKIRAQEQALSEAKPEADMQAKTNVLKLAESVDAKTEQ